MNDCPDAIMISSCPPVGVTIVAHNYRPALHPSVRAWAQLVTHFQFKFEQSNKRKIVNWNDSTTTILAGRRQRPVCRFSSASRGSFFKRIDSQVRRQIRVSFQFLLLSFISFWKVVKEVLENSNNVASCRQFDAGFEKSSKKQMNDLNN